MVSHRRMSSCRQHTVIVIHSALDGKIMQRGRRLPPKDWSSAGRQVLIQEERNRKHLSVWNATEGKLAWNTRRQESKQCLCDIYARWQASQYHGHGDGYRVVNIADGTVVRSFEGRLEPRHPLAFQTSLLGTEGGYGRVTLFDRAAR